jgi:iron-sulfur cluster repair protein YtfE (RIC family)
MKNIFEKLRQDHVEIRNLFEQVLQKSNAPLRERQNLFLKLKTKLLSHTKSEQEFFYENFKQEDSTRDLALKSEAEHHKAEDLLQDLEREGQSLRDWISSLEVLRQTMEEHMRREEKEFFPLAGQIVDQERSEDLARVVEYQERSYQEALSEDASKIQLPRSL